MSGTDAAWRMDVARRAASVYAGNDRLAVFAVAGSVGAGLADEHSDLEIDCYWLQNPSDNDRRRPVDELGGRIDAFWEYDDGDEEWSEDYTLAGLGVTVSNFLASSADRWIREVTVDASTDQVKHMRLAALMRSAPLVGYDRAAAWRAAASSYPDGLVAAMLGQILQPDALAGWAGRDAAAARGDRIVLQGLLARGEETALRALLAVNRTYVPHRNLKWQRSLVDGLTVAPTRLGERLDGVWTASPLAAVAALEGILAEVADLAAPWIDTGPWLASVNERRPVLSAPSRAREPGQP